MSDPHGLAVRTLTPPRPTPSPPVLLVHGFASDGATDWIDTGFAAALAEAGRTVVVPDLRGHGRSPEVTEAAQAHAPAQAADLVEALSTTGPFDVVGYSLGARIAWELPAVAPGRVGRVVLGGLAPGEPFAAVDVAALHRAVRDGVDPGDPFTGMIAGLVRSRGERAAGLARCVEGLRETPFRPGEWAAPVPPVFVVGDNDDLAGGIGGLADRLGEATLVTVPGGHHEVLGGAAFRKVVADVLAR
jgi:pimeloyl-ACP methyl ester carboxylesterase